MINVCFLSRWYTDLITGPIVYTYNLPGCLSALLLLLLLLLVMIFAVPGVFLSCTLCKSCMLIAANGCCWCCCWFCTATDSSDLVLCNALDDLTDSPVPMLFRYCEGLMSPSSWEPAAGNFGGMNANDCPGPVVVVDVAPPPSADSPAADSKSFIFYVCYRKQADTVTGGQQCVKLCALRTLFTHAIYGSYQLMTRALTK